MQCDFLKPDGKRCKAQAMIGASLCFSHNPAVGAAVKRAARVRGGHARRIVLAAPLPPIPMATPQDVITILVDTISRVRSGELDPRLANCIGALAGQLLRAFEIAQTAARIENIQRIVVNRPIQQ